jgi:hypothetical protein
MSVAAALPACRLHGCNHFHNRTRASVTNYIETGATGFDGLSPAPFVGPGGAGGSGGSLSKVNTTDNAAYTNTRITGGTAGTGGAGYGPSEPGGAGGPLGGNGTAITRPTPPRASSTTEVISKATGTGGAGGNGGYPGGPPAGAYGFGGNGGNGYAAAYAYNGPLGPAAAYAYAIGGNGGSGGDFGGNGGIGQIGTIAPLTHPAVVASGTSARAVAGQYGGSGGVSLDGGRGGSGADSTLINAVGGTSEGADLYLKQIARGGAGGASLGLGGVAGAAGNAVSELTFDDTANTTTAKLLSGYSAAYGGAGGAGDPGAGTSIYATPTNGGTAYAKLVLKGAAGIGPQNSIEGAEVFATGGNALGKNTAVGGTAKAYEKATSTTTGAYDVTASVRAEGGAGAGSGAGGAVIGATAIALDPNATGGALGAGGLAYAKAAAYGGNGGTFNGNEISDLGGVSNNGGAGGTVSGTSAYASGYSAAAAAVQGGGDGGQGYGVTGGVSAAGADSRLKNAVSGRTAGGADSVLTLSQTAAAGFGGETGGGTAGAGGYGYSYLKFNDTTANPNHAAIFNAYSHAYGGAGGQANGGTGGANGGGAYAGLVAVGAHTVKATATATGGSGGGSSAPDFPSGGGSGANATIGKDIAYSTGGGATALATASAGHAGAGIGAGHTPGTAGTAIIGTDKVGAFAVAYKQSAYAKAIAEGGYGGYGNGIDGTQGADETLTNAVYGASYYGTLHLAQIAIAGSGGGSKGATAATGGTAKSYLTYNDTGERQNDRVIQSADLVTYVRAAGGAGGLGAGGSSGATGGAAFAKLKTYGAYEVGKLAPLLAFGAVAQGGQGGGSQGSGNAGAGGSALATDYATTGTKGTNDVYAYARANGGLGGDVGGYNGSPATPGNANGGAGGAVTQTYANATGPDQTGGLAFANVVAVGGSGGAGSGATSGAAKIGGQGGTVTDTKAVAIGYSAKAYASQTGGSGGAGDSGASGGDGANSYLKNAVSGTTMAGNPGLPHAGTDGGTIILKETARGGAGGDGTGAAGVGGTAGYGNAYLNFNDITTNEDRAYKLTGSVYGYGGNGGQGPGGNQLGGAGTANLALQGLGQVDAKAEAKGGFGEGQNQGGLATANVAASSDGSATGATVTANAIAYGGSTGTTTGLGIASANASAVTAAGQQATATATAYGSESIDQTNASTAAPTGEDQVLGVSATTVTGTLTTNTPLVDYDATMTSAANIGVAPEIFDTEANPAPSNVAGGTGFAWATGLPTGSYVTAITNPVYSGTNPYQNIDALLGSSHDSDATILGYGIEGAELNDTVNAGTVTVSESFDLGLDALGGQLVLGLADEYTYAPFQEAELSVTVGGTAIALPLGGDYTAAQFAGEFTDSPVGLGSYLAIPIGGLVVTVTLTVITTPEAGPTPIGTSGAAFDFVLGSTGVVSPPVINLTSDTANVTTGVVDVIPGVSISEAGDTTGDIFTVTLTDTYGKLVVTNEGETDTGEITNSLTLVGSLTEVNAALATLTDVDDTSGSDTITINASDTNGGHAIQQEISVTATAPVVLTPVITTPVNRVVVDVDMPGTLQGYNADFTAIVPISISEANSTAGEEFSVFVSDSDGKIAEGSPPAALLPEVNYGQLTPSELEITGTLADVNEALTYITAQNVNNGTITVNAQDQYGNVAQQQTFTFQVGDTPAEVAALTLAEIDQLAADGVTSLTIFGAATVTVDQAQWFYDAGIYLNATGGAIISDTGSDITNELGTQLIAGLHTIGIFQVEANDGSMTLSIAQAEAIEAVTYGTPPDVFPDLDVHASSGTVTVDGTVNQIENLTTAELAGLAPIGVTGITATGPANTDVLLNAAQAQALAGSFDGGYYHVPITAPTGGIVELYDTPAAIQALLQPSPDLTELVSYYTGITEVASSTGALPLTIAEAQVITELGWSIATGTTVTIDDSAADIENYLLNTPFYEVSSFQQQFGFTTLQATDGSVELTVAEAETLEDANQHLMGGGSAVQITVSAPPGDTVTLTDTAADIEAMTPTQIMGLEALGITAVAATDTGLTLSVAQALAFYDPLPITVPPGDQVVIADTAMDIEELTPAEIVGLHDLGVTEFQVTDLTGSDTLTIDGGITLSIAGMVPSGETIDFVGTGGTLSLGDSLGMAGTVYGFTPADTIDLTDATYDGSAAAVLDPTTNILTVTETSGTYTLQLDPSQVFLTTPTFNALPDAGTGTEITYTQVPINYDVAVNNSLITDGAATATVDGAVIASGGEIDLQFDQGDTANRTVIQDGGYLLVESYNTANDTFIQAGGTLELQDGAAAGGDITFGPTTGDPMGGTLLIDAAVSYDFPLATIADFAPGDIIDLTQTAYDPAGSATITSGNTLQIVENGTSYDLTLDPSQDFLNQSFTLTPEAGFGTDVTEVQSPTTTDAVIPGLDYVVGAVVTNGGSVDIQAAGTLTGGTVADGGIVTVEDFATFSDGLINGGGTVDVQPGGSLGSGVNFGSDGGELKIEGTTLPTTTIYGFGGNDTIDLPDVAYVAGTTPTLAAGNQLQFTEGGTAYTLNIDPAQVTYPATYSANLGFELSQDSGTGTEIQLVQAPIESYTYLGPGQSAAGLVVENGGYINDYGSIVNVTINAGGLVTAEDNYPTSGAVGYAVINDGGTLAVAPYTTVTGDIDFGTVGGTLDIENYELPTVAIDGFAPGDVIDLTTYFPYVDPGAATVLAGNVLQFIENGATYDLQLDPTQDFSADKFVLSEDPNNDTFLTEEVACFLPGTRIRTPSGDVMVQDLAVGDTVVTLSGRERRLCWIGKGSALAVRGKRSAATPLIVRRGALADNVPNRDLRITKGHSLFLDGVLIPVEFLVNHRSILWDDVTQHVEIYHLELDEHDILIANGCAAESYRDDGNRWLFDNANSGWDQPPKPPCAPVLTGGPVVDAVWRRLLDRAGGPTRLPLTQDAQVALAVDGTLLAPTVLRDDMAVFVVAGRPRELRLVSRSAVPLELGLARDGRELGVAIRRLAARKGAWCRAIAAADARLADGFHVFEAETGIRWTNGNAALPTDLFAGFKGEFEVTIHLGGATQYMDDGEALRAA